MSQPKRTRLVFLGFADDDLARTVLEVIKAGRRDRRIVLEDLAMVRKDPGGKVTITNDKGLDPGAARGGLFGGAAGAALAVLSGPIGVGAVVGGAALGAISAAVKDSGLKNDDIETVSRYMADDRTGLVVAIPLAEIERWDNFVADHPEFHASDRGHTVDIVPGRTFEQALEEYRRTEES